MFRQPTPQPGCPLNKIDIDKKAWACTTNNNMYKSKVDTVPTHEETKIDENAEPPYYIILFKPWFKDLVSMLAQVLSEEDDNLAMNHGFILIPPCH